MAGVQEVAHPVGVTEVGLKKERFVQRNLTRTRSTVDISSSG